MKKDFFNISLFVNSFEILSIFKMFPHSLYNSYQSLVSSAHLDQVDITKMIKTSITYQEEVYFIMETMPEDASFLARAVKHRIEQYLEYYKLLYSYEYHQNTANDLIGSLLFTEQEIDKTEELIVKYLQLVRSLIPVNTIKLFLVTEEIKISYWLGNKNDELLPPEDQVNHCDLACATLVANIKKTLLSNCPLENKLYQEFKLNTSDLPKNFIYIPLLKNKEVLAILELKNLTTGDFTEKELYVLNCVSKILCQYLSEYNTAVNIRQTEQTSIGLEKYLSSNVVAHIKNKDLIANEITGVEKEIVVLFAKINNFSEISEKLSASSLIDLLNYHYEFMAKIIIEHDGTIDKIIGGVIMAVWGHPKEQHNGLKLALKAAIEMQQTAAFQISLIWKAQGIPDYGLGIGINKGKAVAGNLGANQFMDFTVIGDTINLAQRLEANAKSGEIWLKTEVVNLDKTLKDRPNQLIKGVKVKGIAMPFNVYVYTPLDSKAKGIL